MVDSAVHLVRSLFPHTIPQQHTSTKLTHLLTGGGLFDTGPNFVFNMGGGPGIRVQQFGGNRPRRRQHAANADPNAPQQTLGQAIQSLLPLLLLFLLPLLSSLFSGGDSAPAYRFDGPIAPHTQAHISERLKIPYWVNPVEVEEYSAKKWRELDKGAEVKYVSNLNVMCERERVDRDRLVQEAQGFFFTDQVKMDRARAMDMKNCRMLGDLGYRR